MQRECVCAGQVCLVWSVTFASPVSILSALVDAGNESENIFTKNLSNEKNIRFLDAEFYKNV